MNALSPYIYQTREKVFHRDMKVEKTTSSEVFFLGGGGIRSVWITLSRVFDISSQSKQN